MSLVRSVARQVALSFVVLSAVFAAGFFAGSSATLSDMQSQCLASQGTWANGLCTLAGASQ